MASDRRCWLLPLLLVVAGGCLSMEVPQGFLELRSPGGQIRAVTPDDARLWVREHADPERGGLDFWARALEHDLVGRRAYKLVEAFAVTDGAGNQGKAWRFQVRVDGEAKGYLVAIFVLEGGWWWSSNTIRTVEFEAPEAAFAAQLGAVRAAIGTLRG